MGYSELTNTRRVGRYELSRELGRGGMAVVHLARQLDLDRLVALKELVVEAGDDPSLGRRFLRESRLASSLSHPNIVTILDFFEAEGRSYIAMEYVPRGSLRPRVGGLSFVQAAGVLEGVLAALCCAEEYSIVHRDLKPENVLVTGDGGVKISDFGIAKTTGARVGASFLTAHGTTLGTPHYMAPEQAMGLEVGPPTDLYSVGCMAYELVTGRVPFADTATPMAVMLRHASDVPPPAASVDPRVDARVSEWIGWLLAKDPAQRPQRAAAAWEALEEVVLALSGPRWRRDARLLEPALGTGVPGPFTPPPSTPVPAEPPFTSIAFDTYRPPPPSRPPVGAETELPPDAQREPIPAAGASRAPEPPVAPTQDEPELGPSRAPEPPVAPAHDELVAETLLPRTPPAARSTRPVRRRRVLIPAAALVAVAAGAATLLTPQAQTPPAAERGAPARAGRVTLAAGAVTVRVPADWSTLSVPVDVPGLRLAGGVAAAPGGREADGIVLAGIAPHSAANPALLAAELLQALPVDPSPVEVSLGDRAAYRYARLRPRGLARPLTVYAAPTSAGVATLACIAPAHDPAGFTAACDTVARSLGVRDATALPLGPSRTLATSLNAALGRLASALRTDRLRAARTPHGQASAAVALADAYRRARAALARPRPGPQHASAVATLLRGLAAAHSAYRDLAAGARAGDRARYRRAADHARVGEHAVRAALRAFDAAGYGRLITAEPRPHTIPRMRRPAVHHRPDPGPTPTPGPGPGPEPTPAPGPGPEPTPSPNPTPVPIDPHFGVEG